MIKLEGLRGDQQTQHRFDGAALFVETRCQVIQQFRMRRLRAEPAKVVRGGDDAAAEHMMPQAIHDNARSQRIVLMREARGQLQTPAVLRLVRLGIKRLKKSTGNDLGRLLVVAANKQGLIRAVSFKHAR